MCFSASASFGAGAVLAVIGTVSLKKVESRSQVIFACIPLIFSIQQISEGFLWLSLTKSYFSNLENLTTYIFLFFAQIVWPLCIPISFLQIEKNKNRKKIQKIFVVIGIIVSSYLTYCLLFFDVNASIVDFHIQYEQIYPSELLKYSGYFYFIATIFPPFFSSIERTKILGLCIFISFIITKLFYENYLVSVWCFFASLISAIILLIIIKQSKSKNISLNNQ